METSPVRSAKLNNALLMNPDEPETHVELALTYLEKKDKAKTAAARVNRQISANNCLSCCKNWCQSKQKEAKP